MYSGAGRQSGPCPYQHSQQRRAERLVVLFSAGDGKAADARGRQLNKGGFLQRVRERSPIVMRDRMAVSLDLFPALPPALSLELEE